MSKAKIASKNNPSGRGQTREYFYNGNKIKPVKVITLSGTILGAEIDGSGDLVTDKAGNPLPWGVAKL